MDRPLQYHLLQQLDHNKRLLLRQFLHIHGAQGRTCISSCQWHNYLGSKRILLVGANGISCQGWLPFQVLWSSLIWCGPQSRFSQTFWELPCSSSLGHLAWVVWMKSHQSQEFSQTCIDRHHEECDLQSNDVFPRQSTLLYQLLMLPCFLLKHTGRDTWPLCLSRHLWRRLVNPWYWRHCRSFLRLIFFSPQQQHSWLTSLWKWEFPFQLSLDL